MWEQQQLDRIVQADDLHIAPFRDDGKTPGTPTWIWCVQVDGELYVRAYNGTASRWHQAALKQRAGLIKAAGATFEVSFEPAADSMAAAIDAAYERKSRGSPYLRPMISNRARAATVRIVLRAVG